MALYVLNDGVWISFILGAPEFVNRSFRELFPDGIPAVTPLLTGSNGPASPYPGSDGTSDGDAPQSWPDCLRGDIAVGFSLVAYEGGSVEELEACARSLDITALYTLNEGEFVPYILGAPDFVNRLFFELHAEGLPLVRPLVAKSDSPLTASADNGDASESQPGKFSYYVCQSLLKRGSGTCDTPRLSAKRFERLTIDQIREYILTESNIRDLVRPVDKEMDGAAREERAKLDSIEAELAEVRRRMDRLWHAIETSDREVNCLAPRPPADRFAQPRPPAPVSI